MYSIRFEKEIHLTNHVKEKVIGGKLMKTTYDESDDILVLHLSEKEITKELSQDWHTHISYAEDGTVVEVVILEASKQGAWPLLKNQAA